MFTEKSVSASINVIMTISELTTLYMPGLDSDFDNFIKNKFIEFSVSSVIQNPHSTVPEFIWPALGN